MQMRRKCRQEKPAARARRELAQHRLERTFRARASRALDVGRIREQHGDALGAKLGKALAIEQRAVHRRVVDFEIAAVHDDARRRANRERDRVGRRMRDANRLDRERPRLERMARLNRPQINPLVELRISQAPARERERDVGAIDGNVEAAQQMRQRADVIFVRMRQHHRLDRDVTALEPRHLGDIGPQSKRGLVGEHHAAIDYDRAPGAFDRHQVEADLAQPAKGHDAHRRGHGSACRHCPILPPRTEANYIGHRSAAKADIHRRRARRLALRTGRDYFSSMRWRRWRRR